MLVVGRVGSYMGLSIVGTSTGISLMVRGLRSSANAVEVGIKPRVSKIGCETYELLAVCTRWFTAYRRWNTILGS